MSASSRHASHPRTHRRRSRGIADLAAATGCDADALHAVLGHLVSRGVFTEQSPGQFACNQAAEQLAAVPFLDLTGIGGRMAHTWGTLLDYVRTARTQSSGRYVVECRPAG